MSLIVDKNIGNGFVSEEFNKTKQDPVSSLPDEQDPVSSLPDELILGIFSYLNLAELGIISSVSKEWKRLASDPILWKIAIYKERAFGNDKWAAKGAQFFGEDIVKDEDKREELSSLPSDDFIADCKKFKSIFPGRNAKDSLMLVRLDRVTLKSLGELAKKYFPKNNEGYRFIWSAIVNELGDKSIDKPRWVLMTKDVLPGSRNKSYAEQQKIVADLAKESLIGYEVPETLEAAACILAQYFDSNTRLFSDKPWTYTRCKDKVRGFQTVVGGFAPAGLDVDYDDFGSDYIGVAALRKF